MSLPSVAMYGQPMVVREQYKSGSALEEDSRDSVIGSQRQYYQSGIRNHHANNKMITQQQQQRDAPPPAKNSSSKRVTNGRVLVPRNNAPPPRPAPPEWSPHAKKGVDAMYANLQLSNKVARAKSECERQKGVTKNPVTISSASRDPTTTTAGNDQLLQTAEQERDPLVEGMFVVASGEVDYFGRSLHYTLRELMGAGISVDLVVTETQQPWSVFAPSNESLPALLYLWRKKDPAHNAEHMEQLAGWIFDCTTLRFLGAQITSAYFDSEKFTTICNEDLISLQHSASVKMQSLARMRQAKQEVNKIKAKGDAIEKARLAASQRLKGKPNLRESSNKSPSSMFAKQIATTSTGSGFSGYKPVGSKKGAYTINVAASYSTQDTISPSNETISSRTGKEIVRRPLGFNRIQLIDPEDLTDEQEMDREIAAIILKQNTPKKERRKDHELLNTIFAQDEEGEKPVPEPSTSIYFRKGATREAQIVMNFDSKPGTPRALASESQQRQTKEDDDDVFGPIPQDNIVAYVLPGVSTNEKSFVPASLPALNKEELLEEQEHMAREAAIRAQREESERRREKAMLLSQEKMQEKMDALLAKVSHLEHDLEFQTKKTEQASAAAAAALVSSSSPPPLQQQQQLNTDWVEMHTQQAVERAVAMMKAETAEEMAREMQKLKETRSKYEQMLTEEKKRQKSQAAASPRSDDASSAESRQSSGTGSVSVKEPMGTKISLPLLTIPEPDPADPAAAASTKHSEVPPHVERASSMDSNALLTVASSIKNMFSSISKSKENVDEAGGAAVSIVPETEKKSPMSLLSPNKKSVLGMSAGARWRQAVQLVMAQKTGTRQDGEGSGKDDGAPATTLNGAEGARKALADMTPEERVKADEELRLKYVANQKIRSDRIAEKNRIKAEAKAKIKAERAAAEAKARAEIESRLRVERERVERERRERMVRQQALEEAAGRRIGRAARAKLRRLELVKNNTAQKIRSERFFMQLNNTCDVSMIERAMLSAAEGFDRDLAMKALLRLETLQLKYERNGVVFHSQPSATAYVLVQFFHEPDIVKAGVRLFKIYLRLVPNFIEDAEQCVSVIQFAINIANLYYEDVKICESALFLISKLAESNAFNRHALGLEENCYMLAKLFELHLHNERIVENLCLAVTNICRDSFENKTNFGIAGVCDVVFESFIEHLSSDKLLEAHCDTMLALCMDDHAQNQHMLSNGLYPQLFIKALLLKKNHPLCIKHLLSSIVGLLSANKPVRLRFLDAGLVQLLFEFVQLPHIHPVTLKYGIWVISNTSCAQPAKYGLVHLKVVAFLKNIWDSHQDPELKEMARWAYVRALSASSTPRDSSGGNGGRHFVTTYAPGGDINTMWALQQPSSPSLPKSSASAARSSPQKRGGGGGGGTLSIQNSRAGTTKTRRSRGSPPHHREHTSFTPQAYSGSGTANSVAFAPSGLMRDDSVWDEQGNASLRLPNYGPTAAEIEQYEAAAAAAAITAAAAAATGNNTNTSKFVSSRGPSSEAESDSFFKRPAAVPVPFSVISTVIIKGSHGLGLSLRDFNEHAQDDRRAVVEGFLAFKPPLQNPATQCIPRIAIGDVIAAVNGSACDTFDDALAALRNRSGAIELTLHRFNTANNNTRKVNPSADIGVVGEEAKRSGRGAEGGRQGDSAMPGKEHNAYDNKKSVSSSGSKTFEVEVYNSAASAINRAAKAKLRRKSVATVTKETTVPGTNAAATQSNNAQPDRLSNNVAQAKVSSKLVGNTTRFETTLMKGRLGLGLALKAVGKGSKGRAVISSFVEFKFPDVNPASSCEPPLMVGDAIAAVNGAECDSFETTIKLLQSAENGPLKLIMLRDPLKKAQSSRDFAPGGGGGAAAAAPEASDLSSFMATYLKEDNNTAAAAATAEASRLEARKQLEARVEAANLAATEKEKEEKEKEEKEKEKVLRHASILYQYESKQHSKPPTPTASLPSSSSAAAAAAATSSSSTSSTTIRAPSAHTELITTRIYKGEKGLGLILKKVGSIVGNKEMILIDGFKEISFPHENPSLSAKPAVKVGDTLRQVNGVDCTSFKQTLDMLHTAAGFVTLVLERREIVDETNNDPLAAAGPPPAAVAVPASPSDTSAALPAAAAAAVGRPPCTPPPSWAVSASKKELVSNSKATNNTAAAPPSASASASAVNNAVIETDNFATDGDVTPPPSWAKQAIVKPSGIYIPNTSSVAETNTTTGAKSPIGKSSNFIELSERNASEKEVAASEQLAVESDLAADQRAAAAAEEAAVVAVAAAQLPADSKVMVGTGGPTIDDDAAAAAATKEIASNDSNGGRDSSSGAVDNVSPSDKKTIEEELKIKDTEEEAAEAARIIAREEVAASRVADGKRAAEKEAARIAEEDAANARTVAEEKAEKARIAAEKEKEKEEQKEKKAAKEAAEVERKRIAAEEVAAADKKAADEKERSRLAALAAEAVAAEEAAVKQRAATAIKSNSNISSNASGTSISTAATETQKEELMTIIRKTDKGYGFQVTKRKRMDRLQISGFIDFQPPDANPATQCIPPIKNGDILQAVNGTRVSSFDHTLELLKSATGQVQLLLQRDVPAATSTTTTTTDTAAVTAATAAAAVPTLAAPTSGIVPKVPVPTTRAPSFSAAAAAAAAASDTATSGGGIALDRSMTSNSDRPTTAADANKQKIVTVIERGPKGYGLLFTKRKRLDRLQVQGFAEFDDSEVNPAKVCNPAIQKGDIVQAVNGIKATSFDHTMELLKQFNGKVQVTLERNVDGEDADGSRPNSEHQRSSSSASKSHHHHHRRASSASGVDVASAESSRPNTSTDIATATENDGDSDLMEEIRREREEHHKHKHHHKHSKSEGGGGGGGASIGEDAQSAYQDGNGEAPPPTSVHHHHHHKEHKPKQKRASRPSTRESSRPSSSENDQAV